MNAFYLKRKGILAFGIAHKDGRFVVSAGSNIRNQQAGNMSVYRKGPFLLRKKLIKQGIVSKALVFIKNYEFRNISECTSVILGQSRSGDSWINANDQTYPQWMYPEKEKANKPKFKRGSRFTTKANETFLISQVVENRDEHNNIVYEYLVKKNGKGAGVLIPEHTVIKELKKLIRETK